MAEKVKLPKSYLKEETRNKRAEESEEKKHEARHDKAMVKALKSRETKKKPCKNIKKDRV